MKKLLLLLLLTFCLSAGDVKIVKVSSSKQGDNYTFHVTLLHEDSSWEHYADSWSVLTPDKELIAKRVLWHPHLNEQPFTRSKSGVRIDKKFQFVYIRAHDKVHGYTKNYYKHNLN